MRPFALPLLLLAGCAPAGLDPALAKDLRARLEASERAQAETARKLEDLDNRVFLLTDQVESQKMALARRGGEARLPVITLAPAEDRDRPVDAQPPSVDEPPPGVTSDTPRRSISLRGTSTPWLADDAADAAVGSSVVASAPPPERADDPPPPAEAAPPTEKSGALPPGVASLGVAKSPVRVASGAPVVVRASHGAAIDPASLYRSALDKFMSGSSDEAAQDFRDFVKQFPHHTLADNAQYWLGETFYKRQEYERAAIEFRSVVRRWPSENKVPDALLKLGYCLLALGKDGEGRAVLAELNDHYPNTQPAQYAKKRLDELPPMEKKK